MRSWCLVLFLLATSVTARAATPDYAKLFEGRDGCFVLYDLQQHKTVVRYNERRCAERVAACSTFKVPLALMAFDRGVLKDETTTFKWDGRDRGMPGWNRDTNAIDWLANSVVWYSQVITPKLGAKTISHYLAAFDYGNRDISGGLTRFWLSSTLKLSADEQIRFLDRLWTGKLPVSARARALTLKIMPTLRSTSGAVLRGKTGSGFLPPHDAQGRSARQVGWFVGHLESHGHAYLFATSFSDLVDGRTRSYAGSEARGLTTEILHTLDLF